MKKLLYFLFVAVALMLSSCGGEQEGVHLKNFKIELTEPIETTQMKVKITPSNAECYYAWSLVKKREFLRKGPQYYVDRFQQKMDDSTYPEGLVQGVQEEVCENLYPGTEYVVYAFPVRAGYELDGTIDAFEYATFKTPEIEYTEVPGSFELKDVSYEWSGDDVGLAADDDQVGLKVMLLFNAPHMQSEFTEEDFLGEAILQEKGLSQTYITHAQLRGHVNDISSTYILGGWVRTLDGKQYNLRLHTPLALPGSFRVGRGEDDKVLFSRGNLMYRASTKTWRFAPYSVVSVGSSNALISDTYAGWIDLFGWGTGDAPTKCSVVDADYATFTDWGDNIIDNGSSEPGVWRTLTSDEWEYLFNGRPNAAKLFGYVTIGTDECVFLLPDEWEKPVKLPALKTAEEQGFAWSEDASRWVGPDHAAAGCRIDLLSAFYLAQSGVVFLPMEDYREGTQISHYTEYPISVYWSSTPSETMEGFANCIVLRDNFLIPSYGQYVYKGCNVRLVKDE